MSVSETLKMYCKCGCHVIFHQNGTDGCVHCQCESFRPQGVRPEGDLKPKARIVEGPSQFMFNFPMDRFEIPKGDIPELVRAYIKHIEIDPTSETCKCIWEIHPDYVDVDTSKCVHCGHSKETHFEMVTPTITVKGCAANDQGLSKAAVAEWERERRDCNCGGFVRPKQLKRIKETTGECPVHTKDGLVLGFFEWIAYGNRP